MPERQAQIAQRAGADVLAVAEGEFAMLLSPIERGGEFQVGPGLPEIAGHQLPDPENPVADQARRRSGLRSGFDKGKAVAAVRQTGIVETGMATKI